MPEQPTIHDILGWQQDWDKAPTRGKSFLGQLLGLPGATYTFGPSGQESMADYLGGLLKQSGKYKDILDTGTISATGGELDIDKALSGFYQSEDFGGMSREDLRKSITEAYNPEFEERRKMGEYSYGMPTRTGLIEDIGTEYQASTGWSYGDEGTIADVPIEDLYGDYQTWRQENLGSDSSFYADAPETYNLAEGSWEEDGLIYGKGEQELSLEDFEKMMTRQFDPTYKGGIDFDETDLTSLLDYSQAMQEGLGRVGSITEKFDLKGQLAGVGRGAERDIKTAYESYIPQEIVSRYGALQGGGASPAGEAAEDKYLATIDATKRREGRKARSIYGELEDEMFGGLGSWMENITS